MTLKQYMDKHGITIEQMSKRTKTAQWSLRRYLHGRMPSPPVIRRIFAATKGAVEPNDFYLPAKK